MIVSLDWHEREDCRLCGSRTLTPVLSLPPTPPANELLPAGSPVSEQSLIPLYLSSCGRCGHVQLPVVVSPERLFRNYLYVSGTSPVFVDHFRRYARNTIAGLGLAPGSLVVEIGSNDGTLLKFFKESGMAVVGVDPASDIAAGATARGVMTIPDFFTPDLAEKIRGQYGTADLVVANNVFAHADDLHSMTRAVSALLSQGGSFVFEVSYLPRVVDDCLFDTIYHEHLSYHHLGALSPFFASHGLVLYDAETVDTHGGSIRCYVGRSRSRSARLEALLKSEHDAGYVVDCKAGRRDSPLQWLPSKIAQLRSDLRTCIKNLKQEGFAVVGYGAPAKATTLVHCFDLGSDDLEFIVDDSPLKQGKLLPGKGIPILSSDALRVRTCGPSRVAVIILAWNFADSIVKNHGYVLRQDGVFVKPVPSVSFVTPVASGT